MRSGFIFCTLVAIGWLCLSPNAVTAGEFGGYECMDDCSGHAAGYRWAEENGFTDEAGCPLNGAAISFWEGCKAYVEDPIRGADEDDDGESID